jgi:hypothetical protein
MPIYENLDNKGSPCGLFALEENGFVGDLQGCVDLAGRTFFESFGQEKYAVCNGYNDCPDGSRRVLTVHGIAINQKQGDLGEPLGYFVASHEEDVGGLQDAVNTACGLFCIEHGFLNENGDPVLSMP